MTTDSAGDAGRSPPQPSRVSRIRAAPSRLVTFLIELYRNYVSPMRPPTCRFTPTCSEYAVTALREWGLLRGLALTSWRLAKCGPWYPGGFDPVPQRHSRRAHRAAAPAEPGPPGRTGDDG